MDHLAQHRGPLVVTLEAPASSTLTVRGGTSPSTTRYAVMMLRQAKTLEPPPPFVMPRRSGGWMAS
jgi:hypothetical protein